MLTPDKVFYIVGEAGRDSMQSANEPIEGKEANAFLVSFCAGAYPSLRLAWPGLA